MDWQNILFVCNLTIALLFTFVTIEKMHYKQKISPVNNIVMAVAWTNIICKLAGIW